MKNLNSKKWIAVLIGISVLMIGAFLMKDNYIAFASAVVSLITGYCGLNVWQKKKLEGE